MAGDDSTCCRLHMGSTVPRVAGILGLSSHDDLLSKTNRAGNRVMIPIRYKRMIPAIGFPSGTAYHPDYEPLVRHPELESAIGRADGHGGST